jgi:poly(A) polymerase
VDICFAKVDVETLDDNLDLESNNILINMDETSCKSINGRRVADRILKAVPDQEKFRQTLRIIKLWAKN